MPAEATAFVSGSLHNTNIAVTELRSDNPEHGIFRQDAFLLGYHLVDYPVLEYFEDERVAPVTSLRTGSTALYDLKRDPRSNINKACHCVHLYFPRAALNLIAGSAKAARIEELRHPRGVGVDDPCVHWLPRSCPRSSTPNKQAALTMAIGTHAAKTYGGMKPVIRALHGGLAP